MTQDHMKEISKRHSRSNTVVRDIKIARIFLVIGIFMGAVILITFSLLYYWSLVPEHVLDIKNKPMPVKPAVVREEQAVFVVFDYCKNVEASGTVERKLVSNKTEILAPTMQDDGKPVCQQLDLPILLPPQAAPDKYKFYFTVTYKVNPIRTIVEEFESQEFTIVEGGSARESNR